MHRGVLLCLPALLVFTALASGCATVAPELQLGVRSGYSGVEVGNIAVMPFSLGFSLERAQRAEVQSLYEQAVVEHLQALSQGVVLSPEQVLETLSAEGLEETYSDRLDLGRPLVQLFEEADALSRAHQQARLAFLKTLAGQLNVDSFLLGEVLYWTEARCDATRDSAYTQHVIVIGELSEAKASVPCVVSHIHVKLVEARGGKVIWYNRVLREVRVPMAEAELDARGNAIASVGLLLESRDGLVELLKPLK